MIDPQIVLENFGCAYYLHKKEAELAKKASEAVDYFTSVSEGFFETDQEETKK